MLVRTAVSGVRNSWLASTTRRCCCSRDVSSAINIVLKLAANRPTSSSPRTGMGVVRSCVAAMCSAVSVRRSMGRVARRITSHAASAASAMPASAISTSRLRSTSRTSSVSVTWRAICTAPPLRSDTVIIR